MIAERQQSPRARDTDQVRHEAIRMRLLSQEWAGDSLTELTQTLAKLHALSSTLSHHQYDACISLILAHLDRFTAASQAASTFTNVIAEERKQIAQQITQAEQKIVEEQQLVHSLRQQLEREKRQVDRRAQYDALAKLILDYPPCETSLKELEDARNEANVIAADIDNVVQAKDAVRKELLLLAHCTSELEEGATTLSSLISDKHKHTTHSPEPMDTTL